MNEAPGEPSVDGERRRISDPPGAAGDDREFRQAFAAMAPETLRLAHLDGLRGCAACVVLFDHLAFALNSPLVELFNGNAAVCIFFVLSGYVLAALSLGSGLSFQALALRRYIRLVGPMLVVSCFAWALLAAGLYRNQDAAAALSSWWLAMWYKFPPSFPQMIVETLYGAFASGQSLYNCNLWTMRPELMGSLYIFAISATTRSRGLRTLSYIALALVYCADYLPLFSIGALLCEFRLELARAFTNRGVANAAAGASVFVTGLALCLVTDAGLVGRAFRWLPALVPGDSGMHWHMLGATLLVVATLHWPLARRGFGGRIGRFLGRISFVLYLIQVPVICSFTAWIFLLFAPASPSLAAGLAAVSTTALVIAASAGLYRLIDAAPTRLSRRAGEALDAFFIVAEGPNKARPPGGAAR
ncbi:MAG: acyltransferase [Roseiarcus sp.]